MMDFPRYLICAWTQFPNNEGRFITGNQMLDQRKRCIRLSTGSSAFDNMLGGYGALNTPYLDTRVLRAYF